VKRIFPIIIALIAISLLGIIFLQVQWITGAMKIKRDQYANDIFLSLSNVRDSIIKRKDNSMGGFSFPSQILSFSGFVSTPSVLSNFQLKELIKTELRKKNIRQSFEYCITNEARLPTMFSSGYRLEYLNDVNNNQIYLTPDNTIINTEMLSVYIIQPENYFQNHLAILLIGAFFFTSIIITAFVLTVKTMLSQKKLSEIKSDFINNMTHEFKTPIATINLATDALNNEKVISNQEQIKYYSGIIKEENRRMNKQVEKILQSAQLEREEIKLQLKKIDVHAIVEKVAENVTLQLEEANATLETQFEARNAWIEADEVHFSNILFNLIDNAIKYSKENPFISITTNNIGKDLQVQISDNGIGMSKETIHHIFEKFYRAHTGNLHNVKGFGLGLTYVKKIVDAHGGKIMVTSEPDKGTTFTLQFTSFQNLT
jgi:two-component system phosphate regulon sensor histidine kinase PhoR